MIVGIDFETASAADLKTVGAWAYSLHPSTRVWCAVIGWMDGIDRYHSFRWNYSKSGRNDPPKDLLELLLTDPTMLAHNCAFEKAIWQNVLTPRYGWPAMPVRWEDTQAHAAAANLPVTLEGLGAALGCPIQKDTEGGDLMRKMCWLDKDGDDWRNDHDTPENQERLLRYCETDVRSMFAIWQRVPKMIPSERRLWELDQKINARGMWIDRPLVQRMLTLAEKRKRQLLVEAVDHSDFDLISPTAAGDVKAFLKDRGVELPKVARVRVTGEKHESETVGRAAAAEIAKNESTDPSVRAVLENRMEMGKLASLAKLRKVEHLVDPRDGRLRNSLQFCAAHTGRWSSRGLQVHNFPRDKRKPEEVARVRKLIEGV